MRLQLIRLIVWPQTTTFPPQEVPFATGVVNVITGSSRSGKSAIIPIIDYCLASSDCSIPIDVIRDHASWYGVIFQCDDKQVMICRRAPIGSGVSNDFYVDIGPSLSVPHAIPSANQNTDGVKVILNDISGVPVFRLDASDDQRGYQARLGFRDLMALVFQSQDIVANQNVIFYKMHAHEHRERLRTWFPYILGAETIETLAARQRLAVIDKRISQLRREIEKIQQVSGGWYAHISGHLEVARQYGLFSGTTKGRPPSELLMAAREVLEIATDNSQPIAQDILEANKSLRTLESEEEQLSDRISRLRKQLNDIARLREGIVGYHNTSQKRADRLQLSEWLSTLQSQSQHCPLCGNKDHENATEELAMISAAFEVAELESRSLSEIPPSFLREEQTLKADLEDALSARKALNGRLDKLMEQDKVARTQFHRRKNLFLFLGRLKASLEMLDSIQDGGPLLEELQTLEKEQSDLLETINPKAIQRKVDHALTQIGIKMHTHLQTLDVDQQYLQVPPHLSYKDLTVQVASRDGNWHFLAEVGSASNWVAFHVALMCALHEFFLELPASCVPNFVIFDQPSQVYFPKVKRAESTTEGEDPELPDEDTDAVKKIFRTLANSVKAKNGSWQCIVLDHADDAVYGEIPGVHEVDVWRDGKKLIPSVWYAGRS